MPYPYAFSVTLAPPGVQAAEQQALWLPEPDPASGTRLQERRARIQQACGAACAGLQAQHLGLQDLAELLEEGPTGPDPAAQALARYQRYLNLSCTRPYGRIGLQLFDTQAWLEVELDDPRQWSEQRPLLQRDLAALLGALAQADGLQPPPGPPAAAATEQADALLDAQAPRVAQRARAARAVEWQTRLGRPAMALVGCLMAALTLWLLLDGYRVGTLARLTDAERPLPFVADRLEERPAGWGLFPVYVLHGHVRTDDRPPAVVEASVRVGRDVALRTGNGARYTVLPTRDPAQPHVLRNAHEDTGAVLALGPRGLHWSAALALLPLPLWYACMARPWRATARADAAVQSYLRHMLVRTWGSVVLWGLAMVAVVALGRRFG